ncbi:MAG: pentapeptide repeat-containing protein [Oribacterium parvum]|uniref:pentapeptide repeat-containing protein n=1 Tax=Oribacterium parvum TaxID=1501329 RepID=UPI001CB668BC|nr:pentapeptide repeat-containing protein [Oribacterium parvum]
MFYRVLKIGYFCEDRKINFTKINFTEINFTKINFTEINFTEINFTKTIFTKTEFDVFLYAVKIRKYKSLFLHIFRTFYILYKIKKRGVRSYGIYTVTSITVRGRG